MMMDSRQTRIGTRLSEEDSYYALTFKAFRILAPFYDIIALPVSALRHRVVEFSELKSGARILDVATGTGQQAFAFGRAGFEVTGLDISEDMLAVARHKNKFATVAFELADATKMHFKKGTFDLTTISFGLHDMPSSVRERVITEMVRVTRRDGSVVIVDYALPSQGAWRWVVYHFIKLYEGPYFQDFVHSNLEEILERHGLAIVRRSTGILGAVRVLKCRLARQRRAGTVIKSKINLRRKK